MKKLIGIIIFLIIFLAAGYGVFKFINKDGASIQSVISAEPIVYAHLDDVSANLEELTSTEIYKTLSQIDYNRLLAVSKLSRAQRESLKIILDEFKNPTNSLILSKLFGHEIAIAIYDSKISPNQFYGQSQQDMMSSFEALFSNVSIVTRVKADVKALEVFSRTFKDIGKNLSSQIEEYKGLKINIITEQTTGIRFSYARIKDYLVIGIGSRAVKKAWDVTKDPRLGVSTDKQVQQMIRRSLSTSDLSVFLDMKRIFLFMSNYGAQLASFSKDTTAIDQVDNFFLKVAGFKDAGFSAAIGKLMQMKFDLTFDKKLMDSEIVQLYDSCKSEKNDTLKFIPANAMAYQWTNCFGLDYYWQQVQAQIEAASLDPQSKTPAQRIADVEEQFGLSIEDDVLGAVGDEIGAYLVDVTTGGFFPIPHLAFFLEYEDKTKLNALLGRLSGVPMISFKNENYKGVDLTFVAMSLGADFQPTYAYIDDYLLIAMNKQMVKDAIDTSTGAMPSLIDNESFKKVDFGLSDKNSSLYYLQIGDLVEKVSVIIDWSNQWMGTKNKQKEALMQGSVRRLDDISKKLQDDRVKLKDAKDRLEVMEEDIETFQEQELDVTYKLGEKEVLEEEIKLLQVAVDTGVQQKQELRKIVTGHRSNVPDEQKRALILDELVYPLLDSFKSIVAVGSRAVFTDTSVETSAYMQLK